MAVGGWGKAIRREFGGRRRRWKAGWVDDLDRPGARAAARIDALVFDHGLLRLAWTNRHEVADGVWRSNQPGPRRIRRLAEEGFRTVVNLRGESDWGSYLLEREACAAAGLALVDFRLRSCRVPLPGQITMLAGVLAEAERPLLMHCKSGADRAGFAAAIYLLAVAGRPVEEARRQLALRYLHIPRGPAAVLGAVLDDYAAAATRPPVGFLDWVRDSYDPEALAGRFTAAAPARFLAEMVLRRE